MTGRPVTSDPATVVLDDERKPSSRLWLLAAIGALLLHLGGVVFAVAHLASEDADEQSGAPALEIALELAAPRAEPADLPPGPDTEASTASPAVVEQKAVVQETDLPKDTPAETNDPDRLVTLNESQKPKQDEQQVAAVRATASTESVASEATAKPSSETAIEAPRATAPAQGTASSRQLLRTTWQKGLIAHLDKHKRYPPDRSMQAAEIVVAFELDRTGHVLSATIAKGSGDASFDAAALAMMRRSDPVPAPPPLVADEGLTFTLPVVFRVKGKK